MNRTNAKPNWKTAPEWASYFAINNDGTGWYYEVEPTWSNQLECWTPEAGTKREVVQLEEGNGTLIKKP